ncbi:type II toxin-antitoxin system RelE/ParE family toxin [Algoriphagus formosus]|uniref:Type II toxin-antitoxin system RelE/ParE family toxin n=1 Tax=Algoriphagus formosus TaxID=2007308 RepID=A0A4R5UWM6_9BACT|nr:type II toxin-antitoxin system RelE/ParE family toxin [Algoriphagus aquimaris]
MVNFLVEEWEESFARQFEKRTASFLELLEDFPEIGTVVNKTKKIRGFQLTKQTRIYYRIKGEQILVLTFFDVRQDPDRIGF